MIAKVFNTFSFVPNALNAEGGNDKIADGMERHRMDPASAPGIFIQTVFQKLRSSVRVLVVSIFHEGQLVSKIIEAQRYNDYEVY